jgi:hypothetical protein
MEQQSSTTRTYSMKLAGQNPQGATGATGTSGTSGASGSTVTSGVSGSTGSTGTLKPPVKANPQTAIKPGGTAAKSKGGGKMSRSEFESKSQSFINEALEMARRGGTLVRGVINAADAVVDIIEDVTGNNEPEVVRTFPLPKPHEQETHHSHPEHPHHAQVTEHHVAFHQPAAGFVAVEITGQQPQPAQQGQAFAGYTEIPTQPQQTAQQQQQTAQQPQFCNVNTQRRAMPNRGRPANTRYVNGNQRRRPQQQRPCPPTSAVCECCPQPAPVIEDCGCDDPSKKNM